MDESPPGSLYVLARPYGTVLSRILATGRVPAYRPLRNVHLTLAKLHPGGPRPNDLALRSQAALSTFEASVFLVMLERIVEKDGVRLVGAKKMWGVAGVQGRLRQHLRSCGLGVARFPGAHVTLDYDGDGLGDTRIDPIIWEVDELLLVESVGRPIRHVVHGRWRLQERDALAA